MGTHTHHRHKAFGSPLHKIHMHHITSSEKGKALTKNFFDYGTLGYSCSPGCLLMISHLQVMMAPHSVLHVGDE